MDQAGPHEVRTSSGSNINADIVFAAIGEEAQCDLGTSLQNDVVFTDPKSSVVGLKVLPTLQVT